MEHKTDCTHCVFLNKNHTCQLNRLARFKEQGKKVFIDGDCVSVASSCSAFRDHEWGSQHNRKLIQVIKELQPKLDILILTDHTKWLKLPYAGRIFIVHNEQQVQTCMPHLDDRSKMLCYMDESEFNLDKVIHEHVPYMKGTHLCILRDFKKKDIVTTIHNQVNLNVEKYKLFEFGNSLVIDTNLLRLTRQPLSKIISDLKEKHQEYTTIWK